MLLSELSLYIVLSLCKLHLLDAILIILNSPKAIFLHHLDLHSTDVLVPETAKKRPAARFSGSQMRLLITTAGL